MANCSARSLSLHIFFEDVRMGGPQLVDCCLSLCSCCFIEDRACSSGKELIVFYRYSFPGRVADDAGEAARPASGRVDVPGAVADAEDVRELDVPVKEAVLAGEVRD